MPITKGDSFRDFDVLETGMFFDALSGIGGLPLGRMVEFFGLQNSGKTTAALQVIASAQKQGYDCLLVDAEYQYTSERAEKCGVDTKKLDVMREMTAEDTLDSLEEAIKKGKYKVIVLDSLGQLSSRIWFEKQAGEKTIGTQASLIGSFVMKNNSLCSDEQDSVYWYIARTGNNGVGKIFALGGNKWAEKKKLSFRFREKTIRMQGEAVLGKTIEVIVTKNHVGNTEGQKVQAFLAKDEGFDSQADALDGLIAAGKFRREGNTFFLGETKIGTMKALREWYKENSEKVV